MGQILVSELLEDRTTGSSQDRADLRFRRDVRGNDAPLLEDAIGLYLSLGIRHLRLDLSQIAIIDSSGIGVLVRIFRKLREVGGTMVFVAPSPSMRQVIATLRIDTLIPVVDTIEG